ncbi:uncharacterized protein CC84DRAFT_1172637 [Paraphaeosphaeria sporulosa]|uniref:Uncharacterized protein n=1 Tax=Paraphaeosphaeria sporulosa TaxID=1460663 RepID=A0A177CTE5_9PLEO|nr:uncharacterized protein CC84DRAFT_1172637 [Paraphaeosphaeria sporulosa]OAG10182.1 hypothetical protein CC84DRAFT_1172637 [Paraphaeosphaeria sporulosa]
MNRRLQSISSIPSTASCNGDMRATGHVRPSRGGTWTNYAASVGSRKDATAGKERRGECPAIKRARRRWISRLHESNPGVRQRMEFGHGQASMPADLPHEPGFRASALSEWVCSGCARITAPVHRVAHPSA